MSDKKFCLAKDLKKPIFLVSMKKLWLYLLSKVSYFCQFWQYLEKQFWWCMAYLYRKRKFGHWFSIVSDFSHTKALQKVLKLCFLSQLISPLPISHFLIFRSILSQKKRLILSKKGFRLVGWKIATAIYNKAQSPWSTKFTTKNILLSKKKWLQSFSVLVILLSQEFNQLLLNMLRTHFCWVEWSNSSLLIFWL